MKGVDIQTLANKAKAIIKGWIQNKEAVRGDQKCSVCSSGPRHLLVSLAADADITEHGVADTAQPECS